MDNKTTLVLEKPNKDKVLKLEEMRLLNYDKAEKMGCNLQNLVYQIQMAMSSIWHSKNLIQQLQRNLTPPGKCKHAFAPLSHVELVKLYDYLNDCRDMYAKWLDDYRFKVKVRLGDTNKKNNKTDGV